METERNGTLDLDLVRHLSEARIVLVPPCRLRTVRCYGFYSDHRLIIMSTYLLMGAGRLVALLSWVLALSEPTDWRRGWWRSKHHTKSGTQEWGLGV